MTEDNDYLTMIPCFPKSDTEPTRHLTLITSGLGLFYLGGLGSIILMVMTTRLMSILSEGCDADLGLYSLYSRVRNRLQFGTLNDFIFDPHFMRTNPI